MEILNSHSILKFHSLIIHCEEISDLTSNLLNFILTVYKNGEADSNKLFVFALSIPLVILVISIISPSIGDHPYVIPIFCSFTD